MLALACVALLVASIGALAQWSPWLSVQRITVTGADEIVGSAVRDAAAVPIGMQMVHVDVAGLSARVREIPQVRTVAVRRGWPDTLVVEVVQRTPVAAVPGRLAGVAASYAVVDVDGVVIATAASVPSGLVRLTVVPDRPGARSALRVWSEMPPDIRGRVLSIGSRRDDSVDSVLVQLRGGATVLWGSAESSARKARVLRALLAQDARHYDVSAPDLPTVRLTP